MAITPKGIPLLDGSAKIAPFQAHYNAIANALDTALTDAMKGAHFFTGTAAQRAAFLASAAEGDAWQDTNSTKSLWKKDGGAWVRQGPLLAAGRETGLTITVGAYADRTVTFPSSYFTSTPRLLLSADGPASRNRDCVLGYSGLSASGFTLRTYGTGSTAYSDMSVTWQAVQA